MIGFLLVLIGLNVPILFMFKEKWLYGKKSMLLIFCVNIILFILGWLLDHKLFDAFKMPVISTIIFYGMHQMFKKLYHRNPENTFWTFSKKPLEDILFSLLFWIIGIGLPAFICFR